MIGKSGLQKIRSQQKASFFWEVIILLGSVWVGFSASARNENIIELAPGDKISLYADQVDYLWDEKLIEAEGEVVILRGSETLIADKALFRMKTGEVEVEGEVVYESASYKLSAKKVKVNYRTGAIEAYLAKLKSQQITIDAERIKRISESEYEAVYANYSTCEDCPKSWAIAADRVRIVIDEYIYTYHAFINISEIPVFYIPFAYFPIKNTRESGLLFPSLRFSLARGEGTTVRIPYYHVWSPHADTTLTPGFFGERGQGLSLEQKNYFFPGNWIKFRGTGIDDRLYKEETEGSKSHHFRGFLDFNARFAVGESFRGYIEGSTFSDLNILSDYIDFIPLGRDDLFSGGRASAAYSGESVFGYVETSQYFDHIGSSLEVRESTILGSEPLAELSTGIDSLYWWMPSSYITTKFGRLRGELDGGDLTKFNVMTSQAYFDWYKVNLEGARFEINSNFLYGLEEKTFPRDVEREVGGHNLNVSMFLEYEKFYDEKPKKLEVRKKTSRGNWLGTFEKMGEKEDEPKVSDEQIRTSYHHVFRPSVNYYRQDRLIGESKTVSSDFIFFENLGALERDQLEFSEYRKRLSLKNTFDIRLDSWVSKSKLNYQEIFRFYLSQAFNLENQGNRKGRLLFGLTGGTGPFSISIEGVRFHDTDDNIFEGSIGHNSQWVSSSLRYFVDVFNTPRVDTYTFSQTYRITNEFNFRHFEVFDNLSDEFSQVRLGFNYRPKNNCWRIGLDFGRDLTDDDLTVMLELNLTGDSYIPIGWRR